MRVLVACESSGRVREAFRRRGHDAWSCDLQPAEDGSRFHVQGDARLMLRPERICGVQTSADCPPPALPAAWDLVIAHPPCTRLTNSGVRWLKDHVVKRVAGGDYFHDGAPMREALKEAAAFFNLFQRCAPRVCIENPIPHRYARDLLFANYDQIIQPWQFWHLDEPGAGEQKATCLWLHGLKKLKPTTPNETGRHQACWRMPPTKDKQKRAIERSRTYLGIADAMAEQWGGIRL
jgi:hypothetical protein